jgi:pimeloyl-ACP methyl ester carboxylesterase
MTASEEPSPINWDIDSASGLVRLSNHSLFLRAAGPQREPGTPAIIIEAGLGHSSVYWTTVARQISEFGRVFSYDRSGYGGSEPSSLSPRTADNLALELKQLLDAAGIKPPYIMVAHSFAGIISREFMALNPANIAGMVFVDANTVFSYNERPDRLHEAFGGLMEHLDYNEVLALKRRQKMNSEEFAAVLNDLSEVGNTRKVAAEEAEIASYRKSADILHRKGQLEKQILGKAPVSVIKGHNDLEFGIFLRVAELGDLGTEEHRTIVRDWVSKPEREVKLQQDQLKLSSRGRLVYANKSGHDVEITEPEIVTEEVRWILKLVEEDKANAT